MNVKKNILLRIKEIRKDLTDHFNLQENFISIKNLRNFVRQKLQKSFKIMST